MSPARHFFEKLQQGLEIRAGNSGKKIETGILQETKESCAFHLRNIPERSFFGKAMRRSFTWSGLLFSNRQLIAWKVQAEPAPGHDDEKSGAAEQY